MMYKNIQQFVALGSLLALLGACTPMASTITKDNNLEMVEKAMHAPRQDHTETGSLWSNTGATIFADPKANAVGDLVTVLVSEKASATRNLGTKKNKKSSHKTAVTAALGYETSLAAKNPNFKPSSALDLSNEKSFDGSGQTSNSDTLTASVTSVVTEVFPNGNLRIVGRRQLTINNQPQALTFSGVIRPLDITSDNTVPSSKVAQAVISYGGGGDLASVAHEGWLGQTLDVIWPF
ncbi:MAG: flagellar basal body L-ring protein FlgH [Mariprofundaceae bacterium]|nr:flagellar basal body L-ring protein FlgH [Mariprofundaceae bacterium]